jgi:ABC-2 type transport system permease protein
VPALRVYWRFARTGFRRESRYLMAAFAGLFTNVVFGFIKAAVLVAAAESGGGTVAGYTIGSIGAYVWLSQGMLGAVTLSGQAEIGDRIRTGDVAIDLTRPVDVQLSHLATDLGRAVFTLLPRGVPSVIIGALTIGLAMPSSVIPYVLGAMSLGLGIALSFLSRFALNVIGFWVVETRGLTTVYIVVSTFLSGLFVPVPLFPSWLETIAYATPFPSIMQTPIDVLSGRVTGADSVVVVLTQLAWVVAVAGVGRLLMARGLRKLEVQGG